MSAWHFPKLDTRTDVFAWAQSCSVEYGDCMTRHPDGTVDPPDNDVADFIARAVRIARAWDRYKVGISPVSEEVCVMRCLEAAAKELVE